jgi:DNA-binding NarL/FixJ family response regulator
MKTTTIAIVDDHKLFARSLEILIKSFPEYSVLFCCADGFEFTQKISAKFKPDIVLLDQNMPNMDGPETVEWLKEKFSEIKVVILSMNHNEEDVVKMVLNGISGYVLKDAEISEFKMALDIVRDEGFYFPTFVTGYLVASGRRAQQSKTADKSESLKPREIEFIKLASSELTYKEIADRMCVSLRTVDGYREHLFKKLDIKNRVGLVLHAVKNKWI